MRWWGSDPTSKQEEEIDIVCSDQSKTTAVCECKWRNQLVGISVLRTLDYRAGLIHAKDDVYRYVFSKSGFSQSCLEAAHDNPKYRLVSFEDMI